MSKKLTNRDVYLGIHAIIEEHKESSRSSELEKYLLAMLRVGRENQDSLKLSVVDFLTIISNSFISPSIEFDNNWREKYEQLPVDDTSYVGWEARIIRQIVDLRELDESGGLNNKFKYFGLAPPRDRINYWYNFDPNTYLERAASCFFGWYEWETDGKIVKPPDSRIVEISSISWEAFRDFLYCGQIYE